MIDIPTLTCFAKKLFLPLREVRNVEVTDGALVRITLDIGVLNTFVQRQLENGCRIIGNRFPGASFCVIAYEGNYITKFPFQTEEARLSWATPSSVPTRVGYDEPNGIHNGTFRNTDKRNRQEVPFGTRTG